MGNEKQNLFQPDQPWIKCITLFGVIILIFQFQLQNATGNSIVHVQKVQSQSQGNVFKNWTKFNDTFSFQHHYFPNGTHRIFLWEVVGNGNRTKSSIGDKNRAGTFEEYLPDSIPKGLIPKIPQEPDLNWNYAFTLITVVSVLLILIVIAGLVMWFKAKGKRMRGTPIYITNSLGGQGHLLGQDGQKNGEKMPMI